MSEQLKAGEYVGKDGESRCPECGQKAHLEDVDGTQIWSPDAEHDASELRVEVDQLRERRPTAWEHERLAKAYHSLSDRLGHAKACLYEGIRILDGEE